MLPAKLLRYRRSSDNRKKRKTKEKAENAKQKRQSRNARATEAEKVPVNPEKTDEEGLESREDEIKRLQETAECYHRHALHFFGKWREAETGTLRVIEERDLTMMEREIGRGCFGTC